MSKSTPPPPAERLAAAMKAKGIKNAHVADHADVTPGAVSQWVKGRRPVPANKAQLVGEFVGLPPEQISAKYAEIAEQSAIYNVLAQPNQAGDQRPLDLTIHRLEADIDSLRLALGVMAGVMTAHRPAEAADVAKALRKHLRGKFVRLGYVKELLSVLEGGT